MHRHLSHFHGNLLTTIYMVHDDLRVSIPTRNYSTNHFSSYMQRTYHEQESYFNMHVQFTTPLNI